MIARDIIVVGGSAGGIDALQNLVRGLSPDLTAAVFVVIHSHPTSPGYLPEILSRSGSLPAAHAVDDEPIRSGRIYVAPPDYHLAIEHERVRLSRGPKENRTRPAVDPLFRSAAYFHGPRVIGVVLSGMLDDGTAGLWAIKDRGGLAVVQDPDDAAFRSMPESALRHVAVDYRLPAGEIGPMLSRESGRQVPAAALGPASPSLSAEARIALGASAMESGIPELGELSPLACPECHGVMVQLSAGGLLRFRCHTGHAFSAGSLLDALSEAIEGSIWSSMRGMEERAMLLRHMSRHVADSGDSATAARFMARADQAVQQSRQMRQMAVVYRQPAAEEQA